MKTLIIMLVSCFISAFSNASFSANGNGRNGTTLAAYKTLDICTIDPTVENPNGTNWRYSGVVTVWNEGAQSTVGFNITDKIQSKLISSGTQFVDSIPVSSFSPALPAEIPAGTMQLTALPFTYSVDGPALIDSYIRNSASLTITNHSGALGTPTGPNPKATYTGTIPPKACQLDPFGCTYTQGYWGNKPGVQWPLAVATRETAFYLSGQTWQQVLDTPVNKSQGYYQLAHQFIAARLNIEKIDNTPSVPDGISDTLNLAAAWLATHSQSTCTSSGSCGTQKDWAATLDLFNNGVYVGGPPHCSNE